MSEAEDIKKNMDMMRATVSVVEILLPFAPIDRLRVISGAVAMGGMKAVLLADIEEAISKDPALKDLMTKIRPMRL